MGGRYVGNEVCVTNTRSLRSRVNLKGAPWHALNELPTQLAGVRGN